MPMSDDEQHNGDGDRSMDEGKTTEGLLVTQPLVQQQPTVHQRAQLSAVPGPGQPADRRAEVARWVVTLSEPLLTTEERIKVESDMADFINRNSDWACAYFAGLLTDLSATLSPDDPWRRLSALIDLDQVALGHSTDNPDQKLAWSSLVAPVPSSTGAVIKHPGQPARPFGTSADVMDMVNVDVTDPSAMLEVSALMTNLSPLAAAFVAFAASDARTMQVVLSKTRQALFMANFGSITPDTVGESMLKTAGQAVAWLVHRRRQYLLPGEDDRYAHRIGFEWMSKADRVNQGKPIATEQSLVGWSMIQPTDYKDLAGDDYVE